MGTNFDNLWMFSYEKRLQALETTFVQGVKDGSLDPVVFGGFVIQDCVFLYEEYRCIKSAMDKATDGQMKACLKKLTQRYEGYYVDAFEKWHINPNNTSSVQLDEACQEYISYIQNAADNMATIDFLLSIAPCLSLWSW
ncbi:aminopyrimidine aminohydrolase-like [Argopecten irradians]|uniref:aminopyrimidine aminohydrolase-like n=1 Tax=Argopecten irradians TaxID=31199 RepID=UPI0037216928